MMSGRPLRILYISDVYFPRVNGVSTSIETFRKELAALGHEIVLVAPAYPALYADNADTVRVPSWQVPGDPEDRAMHWRKLREATRGLNARRFDIVHVQTPFLAHYAGMKLAREWQLPCVITYHTLFEEYLGHYLPMVPRRAVRYAARAFSRSQCNSADLVIVPSTAMRETMQRYGVTARVEIVPTGIPLDDFANRDGARFRAQYGIAAETPVLLFVGRVAFEKNIEFLLRVVDRVRHAVRDVLLVVSGEGPALASLRRAAADAGLRDHVRFVGYLDRPTVLADCYAAADVFVFASRTETQGLVLLEAMAAGLPVVSTAVMGTRDIVGPGRGALVAEDDEDDFAAKVVTLLRNPDLKRNVAGEGIEYARTWSAAATAVRLQETYLGLTGQRPR